MFRDREDAGGRLGERLHAYDGQDALVLGLARGGVPVAAGVAEAIGAELDVLVVRKLGAPGQPEFGFGAIAKGETYVEDRTVELLGLSPEDVSQVVAREREELGRRERAYRGGRPFPRVEGRVVLLVDDGIATGGTARAALRALRRLRPARLVFAAPVGPRDTREAIADEADEIVLLETPERFLAVGEWYSRFGQTSDDEVLAILHRFEARETAGLREIRIPAGAEEVHATLARPADAMGLVVFAHGSGSSRFSPRNRYVARVLQDRGLATLLVDLLTPAEEHVDLETRELRFDIGLLARRVAEVVRWTREEPPLRELPVGLFGSSTGAAAALVADTLLPGAVDAIVSRGGRPDLAEEALPEVRAPTLLVVGGRDEAVLGLNEKARRRMEAEVLVHVVPGATHLFEEPGALEEVAGVAADFFAGRLAAATKPPQEASSRGRERAA